MSITFTIPDSVLPKLHDFINAQQLDKQELGAIGGAVTYYFTPTSIGVVIKVKNAINGQEIDLSEYETW